MRGIFGAGFGALLKTAALCAGGALLLAAFFAAIFGDEASFWMLSGLGVLIIGMGIGAWKLLSDVGTMQSAGASSTRVSRGYRRPMRLPRVPGGILGMGLWMAVGAALALSLQQYFPPEMVEWVGKGEEFVANFGKIRVGYKE